MDLAYELSAAGHNDERETEAGKAEEESISGFICRLIFGQSPLTGIWEGKRMANVTTGKRIRHLPDI